MKSKTITLSDNLFTLAERKAEPLGISTEEYVNRIIEKELTPQKAKNLTPSKPSRFYAKDEEEIRRGF